MTDPVHLVIPVPAQRRALGGRIGAGECSRSAAAREYGCGSISSAQVERIARRDPQARCSPRRRRSLYRRRTKYAARKMLQRRKDRVGEEERVAAERPGTRTGGARMKQRTECPRDDARGRVRPASRTLAHLAEGKRARDRDVIDSPTDSTHNGTRGTSRSRRHACTRTTEPKEIWSSARMPRADKRTLPVASRGSHEPGINVGHAGPYETERAERVGAVHRPTASRPTITVRADGQTDECEIGRRREGRRALVQVDEKEARHGRLPSARHQAMAHSEVEQLERIAIIRDLEGRYDVSSGSYGCVREDRGGPPLAILEPTRRASCARRVATGHGGSRTFGGAWHVRRPRHDRGARRWTRRSAPVRRDRVNLEHGTRRDDHQGIRDIH